MKYYRTIVASILLNSLLGMACCVQAQVVVNFTPAVYGQTLDGLVYAQLINSFSVDLKARLTIKVRDTRGTAVVSVQTSSFILRPGVNELNKKTYSSSRFNFGNNSAGLTLSQTGRFPEGEYEYCFEIDVSESKNDQISPLYENCFVHQLQPMTPLLLIDPVDGDEFCNKRPNFMWQSPLPLPRDARHRLVLTEIRDKQDIVQAITYNPPIINQGNIPGNTMFYPANAPELKEGHCYAWQVVVYTQRTILARSEVWTFVHKCKEEKMEISGGGYRELKETDDGNFYIASKQLSFSLNNPYNEGPLNYTITSLAETTAPVKGLPALKLKPGLNKYDIDLTEIRAFKNDQEYLLKVQLQQNRTLLLRFIYKDE